MTAKDPDAQPPLTWEDGSSSVDIISETSVFDEDDVTGEALILDPGPLGVAKTADLPPLVVATPQHIYVDEETAAKVVPAAVLHRTGLVPGAMSPYEAFVLDLINGRLSVVEIQRAGLLSREEITRVLLSLLDRNLIGAEPPAPAEDPDEATREEPAPDFSLLAAPSPAPPVLVPWEPRSDDASSSDLRWIRPSLPVADPAPGPPERSSTSAVADATDDLGAMPFVPEEAPAVSALAPSPSPSPEPEGAALSVPLAPFALEAPVEPLAEGRSAAPLPDAPLFAEPLSAAPAAAEPLSAAPAAAEPLSVAAEPLSAEPLPPLTPAFELRALASPEPEPIPLPGAVREPVAAAPRLSVPPASLRPGGLLPPPPMIAARLSSGPAAPASPPPLSLVIKSPYDAPQLSELNALVPSSSMWLEVRPSSTPPPPPAERPAFELAPAPAAAPALREPPPIPLDLPTPLPTLEEVEQALTRPPTFELYEPQGLEPGPFAPDPIEPGPIEPKTSEDAALEAPSRVRTSTLPPPLAARAPSVQGPALPPKLDPTLLREATPPPVPTAAPGLSYGAHRAKKLFEAAIVARNDSDFVSARMNLKLAIAFDPTNLKYQRLFIELGDLSSPTKPTGLRMASHQAQRAYDDGCAAESRDEIDVAIRHFEAALKHSEHPAVLNRLGVLLAMKKKEYLRAQQLVERALELSPDNSVYTHNLTKILTRRAAEPAPKPQLNSSPSEPSSPPAPRKSGFFQRLFGRDN